MRPAKNSSKKVNPSKKEAKNAKQTDSGNTRNKSTSPKGRHCALNTGNNKRKQLSQLTPDLQIQPIKKSRKGACGEMPVGRQNTVHNYGKQKCASSPEVQDKNSKS